MLAFCGLMAVFSDGIVAGKDATLTGDLLSLGSGILWALTSIVIKRSKLVATSAEKLLLYQLAGAAVVGVLVLPFAGPLIREIAALPTLALMFHLSMSSPSPMCCGSGCSRAIRRQVCPASPSCRRYSAFCAALCFWASR